MLCLVLGKRLWLVLRLRMRLRPMLRLRHRLRLMYKYGEKKSCMHVNRLYHMKKTNFFWTIPYFSGKVTDFLQK